MRALGLAIVTASLALSAGGVSIRRSLAQAQPPAQAAASAEDAQTCPVQPDPALRRVRLAAPAESSEIVSLGTRGFNYSRPGDPVPTEVRPSAEAPAAPAD
jgi:hypothetical protein